MTTSQRIDGGKEPGVEQDAPRKVALIANCLLNQNAKVCEGAHYPGVVSPVVEALRSRGYRLQQLPCPELAFAGVRRWWAVFEQYDTPVDRAHCRRLAQAIAPLIEQYLRCGDEVILIGLDGSPSTGVRFSFSRPDWGGRRNRPEDDWEIVPRRGVWIEKLEAGPVYGFVRCGRGAKRKRHSAEANAQPAPCICGHHAQTSLQSGGRPYKPLETVGCLGATAVFWPSTRRKLAG
jgi:predicted secreted protein